MQFLLEGLIEQTGFFPLDVDMVRLMHSGKKHMSDRLILACLAETAQWSTFSVLTHGWMGSFNASCFESQKDLLCLFSLSLSLVCI